VVFKRTSAGGVLWDHGALLGQKHFVTQFVIVEVVSREERCGKK
jgi:hypothetical protein